MNAPHAVKHETFNVDDSINVDPKGFIRDVDSYQVHPYGLYMRRGADHPEFGYLESWLLPEFGLRANIFHYREGHEKPFDFYFDVVAIDHTDATWTTRDLYIDLLATVGKPIEVVDIDELSVATSQGFLSAEDAEFAIEKTLAAVEGITRHGDDPFAWLAAHGAPITWAEHVELVPAS